MRYIKNLTYETQNLLRRFHHSSQKHEVRQRAQCILLSFQRFTIEQLTKILTLHRNTIYNYLNAWEKEGLLFLYNEPKTGRNPKIRAENEAFVKEKIEKTPQQARKVLLQLEEEKGLKICLRTLQRFLKKVEPEMEKSPPLPCKTKTSRL